MVGCYAPHPQEGAPCASNGACPEPLACSLGHCVDRANIHDASVDVPAACTPIAGATGMLTAPSITAPTIDGDLSDWTTCFVAIAADTNPTRDLGANGMFPSGRFSIAHDATNVFIAAEVMGVLPLGDQPPPAVYQNNSISFYLDGDGVFTSATYDADAAQIVVDHANQVQAFRSGTPVALTSFASAARTNGATYTVELAVRASTFGDHKFGTSIGFDIGFEGGDGTQQFSEVLWVESCGPPACGCTDGSVAPYCDERELGLAHLAP
jgi:hypothetical protein